ncbi:uncharacterized protein LOC114404457 [Glycine soja]|uniref:uncharacterized protein LOC114404457 n=1 Tax=Glycine soja TaxID=3848 RepID=UPI001039EF46|nr:uncharacterized protein LOC114404457 [Glycine soja]
MDGSLPRLALYDPNFALWDHCNTLVVSWLHQSLDPEILQTIMWMENASDSWNTLKKHYYQGDVFRISDLQEEIYLLKQEVEVMEAIHQVEEVEAEAQKYALIVTNQDKLFLEDDWSS